MSKKYFVLYAIFLLKYFLGLVLYVNKKYICVIKKCAIHNQCCIQKVKSPSVLVLVIYEL